MISPHKPLLLWGGTWENAGRTESRSRVRWSTGASETSWVALFPGTQTLYKWDLRDHRRTRGGAARWNAGTRPVSDQRGVWVCGATLTWFHSLAEGAWVGPLMTLSNRPLLPAGERGRRVWSGVGPSMTLHVLLGPRGRENRFLSRLLLFFFLNQKILRPALLRGRERCIHHLLKQSSFPLGRPSWGLLLFRSPPGLTGAWTGGAACLRPAQRHRFWRLLRMRCGSRDGCRGRPRRRAGWGAAASGRVEAAAARWAGCVGSPQSAPKQPRTAGPCSRLCRRRGQSGTQGPWGTELCQHPHVDQTQPGDAPGPQVWTSHDPKTTQWPSSLVARGQKWYKALSELLDRDHPRACPPVLLAWRTCSNASGWQLLHESHKHRRTDQTSTYRPGRGSTVYPAGWRRY